MAEDFRVPLIIRGEVIDDAEIEHGGRRGGVTFHAPDLAKHVAGLPLRTPSRMADLYTLSLDDIIDFLVELGPRLNFDQNRHVQEAFRLSCITSGLSESILRYHFSHLGVFFDRAEILRMVERSCGIAALEG